MNMLENIELVLDIIKRGYPDIVTTTKILFEKSEIVVDFKNYDYDETDDFDYMLDKTLNIISCLYLDYSVTFLVDGQRKTYKDKTC